jgi:catechol 2,3-dioxygenase-like lactoylglutathione lyase family enzyme
VLSKGPPNALLSAGYAAADEAVLQSLAARAAASRVLADDIDSELFEFGAIAFRDPDGNRIVYGLPAGLAVAPEKDAPPARLQHVVVGTTDVARMVAFYTTVVGLRESDDVLDDEGGLRSCFLRSDDEHHSFAVFQASANRLDHYCYELPDWNGIRDWGDRLAARRVTVKWGPGRHGPGNNLFLFFHDPDGNWVELSAELERVSADRPAGTWRHEERTLNSWGRAPLRS